ncbi:MAG: diguanylate cyclase [Myxococcales bacterium]|nr:diguanylate cyclase [Myxococcales bacterium]
MDRRSVILIADDQPENLRVLSDYLDQIGFDILVAMNGRRAVDVARANIPDLILIDIVMPEMDGYQACIELKSDDRTRDIPLLFLSAKHSIDDVVRGFELGAVDFLRKPFNLTELFVRLRTHLELKRLREVLQHKASIDGLTEVANRHRFEEYLSENWSRATRSSSELSLVMIDVDYFKGYNDHFGHTRGDLCLKRIAQILRKSAKRPTDLVCRYGGEEFACLLPDTDLAGAATIAQRMLEGVRGAQIPHPVSPLRSRVTISCGVASTSPGLDCPPTSLVEAADAKLYQAKHAGRDTVFL